MKLSEAIKLGIGAIENDGTLWLRSDPPGGCAIGTALFSLGYRVEDILEAGSPRPLLYKHWPWLVVPIGEEHTSRDIVGMISFRHNCGETREALAAWIATIEPQEDEAVEPVASEADHEHTRP